LVVDDTLKIADATSVEVPTNTLYEVGANTMLGLVP
jgi:hypothetical protein